MNVQTRSEKNGIQRFETLEQAFKQASIDTTIWKISFRAVTGTNERVRLILNRNNEWVYEPIAY